MSPTLSLGIDTGGTYTDAVLVDADQRLVAKAKALTTRHDLSHGIAGAVDAVLRQIDGEASAINLVSLSTTLATNALVEGQGSRAGLVMIGFDPGDLQRDGLAEALGSDPVVFTAGGHNVHGHETQLDLTPLDAVLDGWDKEVAAVAIAGYFAVRNPAHEIAARERIQAQTDLPVTCSHELSSRLGGPRRALTTLLNARLVAMIDGLIGATQAYLLARGIAAPLMVVRGDGALIAADVARRRPIETILSGPAASLVGARHLTGADTAIVSDIGGTTTDVAILEKGMPRLDPDGAIVGGFRTMVEAVAMRTYGLGGDSELRIDETGLAAQLTLGPRRLVPLSLAGHLDADTVVPALRRQLQTEQPGRLDGRFARLAGVPDRFASGLQPQEAALFERLGAQFQPLDRVLTATPQRATLDRLVRRGLVQLAGFTPSDAMHIVGRQSGWNGEAARLGGALAARRRTGSGKPVAADAEALALLCITRLTRQSAEVVLSTCLAEDGQDAIDPQRSAAIDSALIRRDGIVRFGITLDRPLIGLGASAGTYYPAIAEMLDGTCLVPEHADVANAVGAVVGQVRITVLVTVTQPQEDLFTVSGGGRSERVAGETEALQQARVMAGETALARANAAGAAEATVELYEEVDAATVEDRRTLVEARVRAIASGRPRVTRAAE